GGGAARVGGGRGVRRQGGRGRGAGGDVRVRGDVDRHLPAHPAGGRTGAHARGRGRGRARGDRAVNVLVVSGIWPPDVGGPASHAPDVADYLLGRGHSVEVVTTASAPPSPRPYPVRWVARRLPKGVIHVRTALLVAERARRADVVYPTGMFGRSASGSTAARRPYVVKLTADPAFERSRRTGLVSGTVDEFQSGGGGLAGRALRAARD